MREPADRVLKKVKVTDVHTADGDAPAKKKTRYQWKASRGIVEYPKLRLHARDYGTDWVAFGKARSN